MASADLAQAQIIAGPVPMARLLDVLVDGYGRLGDGLAALHLALIAGEVSAIEDLSRTVAELTADVATVCTDAISTRGQSSATLPEFIQDATDRATSPVERDRLIAGAELIAERMARVLMLRERIGSLATDLADANGQTFDVVRTLDGRGGTYDRTSVQRSGGRSLTLFDTHA